MTSKRWLSILVALLLLASVALFSIRGPVRLWRGLGWNDFLSPYIQANAWAHGKDPYSAKSLISLWPIDLPRPPWVDTEAANGKLETNKGVPSPYPISSFVVLSPFTLLPWTLALLSWMLISVAAVVLAAFALLSICGRSVIELRAQLFLAALFALAPLHTGIGTGNPAVLVVAFTVFTVWAARSGRESAAGTLLALAICLKPTVAGGLLLYYLIRRRWKIAGIACAVSAMIAVLGVSRLALASVPWFSSYIENTRRMFVAGSIDDFTRTDAIRYNMVNAQVFFYSVLRNPSAANRLSLLLGVTLLGCWLWLCYRRRIPSELLEISAISVLSLISVYHRFYDAGLLIWPLAWSVLVVSKRLTAAATLLTILPFLVPGAAILAERAAHLSPSVAQSWWWIILVTHQVWDLILLAVLLLYFMAREYFQDSVFPTTSTETLPSDMRRDSAGDARTLAPLTGP